MAAARACGLMILAQVKAALGSLERVERVVKLGAFVNSAADFTDQPKVATGASDLMVEVFGDKGRHARAAVGVLAMPLGGAGGGRTEEGRGGKGGGRKGGCRGGPDT